MLFPSFPPLLFLSSLRLSRISNTTTDAARTTSRTTNATSDAGRATNTADNMTNVK